MLSFGFSVHWEQAASLFAIASLSSSTESMPHLHYHNAPGMQGLEVGGHHPFPPSTFDGRRHVKCSRQDGSESLFSGIYFREPFHPADARGGTVDKSLGEKVDARFADEVTFGSICLAEV